MFSDTLASQFLEFVFPRDFFFSSSTLTQLLIPMVISQNVLLSITAACPWCQSSVSHSLITISSLSGQRCIDPIASHCSSPSSCLPFSSQSLQSLLAYIIPDLCFFRLAWLNTALIKSAFPSTNTCTYQMSVAGEQNA